VRGAGCKLIAVQNALGEEVDAICGTKNATVATLRLEEANLMRTCMQTPTPDCYLKTQDILLKTGCINCLPYIQDHDSRATEYCEPHKTREECSRTVAPCPRTDPVRMRPLPGLQVFWLLPRLFVSLPAMSTT
jgi:hypothetical protein